MCVWGGGVGWGEGREGRVGAYTRIHEESSVRSDTRLHNTCVMTKLQMNVSSVERSRVGRVLFGFCVSLCGSTRVGIVDLLSILLHFLIDSIKVLIHDQFRTCVFIFLFFLFFYKAPWNLMR